VPVGDQQELAEAARALERTAGQLGDERLDRAAAGRDAVVAGVAEQRQREAVVVVAGEEVGERVERGRGDDHERFVALVDECRVRAGVALEDVRELAREPGLEATAVAALEEAWVAIVGTALVEDAGVRSEERR